MKRRSFLKESAAVGTALPFASNSFAKTGRGSRPNFLVICCDQLQSRALRCNGNQEVHTPNIDRLASNGCSFLRAYCNNSVCMPSRATMITGLYPRQHGCITNGTKLPANIPTLPAVLSRYSYRTHSVGKLHFQPLDTDQSVESKNGWLSGFITSLPKNYYGFQSSDFLGGHVDFCFGDYVNELRRNHPGVYEQYQRDQSLRQVADPDVPTWVLPVPPELHYNNWIAQKSIRFIESCKDDPFFLWCSFPDPHFPFAASIPYADMYDPASLTIPPTMHGPQQEPETLQRRREYFKKTYSFGENALRESMAQYYGMITHVDECVGKILDAVESSAHRDNTVIVFLADHGEYLGSHHLIKKADWMYEDLVRIPMIWKVPQAVGRGKACDQIVSQIDLVPTLLDYAGIPVAELDQRKNYHAPPLTLPGRSLRPFLQHGQTLEDRPAFVEYDEDWHASGFYRVRTLIGPRYKLVVYTNTGGGQLFDLQNDPFERRNLWNSETHQMIKAELMETLLREASTNDRIDQRRWCGA